MAPGCFASSMATGVFSSYDRLKIVEWGIFTVNTLSRQIFRALAMIAGEWEVVDRYIVNKILSSWCVNEYLFHIIRWTWLIRSATPSTAMRSADATITMRSAAASALNASMALPGGESRRI